MASSIVLSDNGVTSGSAGIKSTGGNDGVLLLQTTTASGTATTAVLIDNAQNVGVGVTPNAWGSSKAIQVGGGSIWNSGGAGNIFVGANYYFDGTNRRYIANGFATEYLGNGSDGTHKWYTAPSGTAGNAITFTQAMTLDASGGLSIGRTSTGQGGTTGVSIEVTSANGAGNVWIANSGTTSSQNPLTVYSTGASAYRFYIGMQGQVYATNTTITAISDQRLKENIVDLDVGLNSIMALKPRKFDWKEGKGKDIKGDRGFIAQEFEAVFPDMIEEWLDPAPEGEDPYKSVRADLIPVLVKAIQEQQSLIQSLTDRLTALEGAAK